MHQDLKHQIMSIMHYHSIILLINSEFALIYNIFVTPIYDVKIWAYAPNTVPATCNLDIDNAPRTYWQVC